MRCAIIACRALPILVASITPGWADEVPLRASYAAYAHGLNILNLDMALTLRATDYRLQIAYRLSGLVGVLIHGAGATVVDGRFAEGRALPRELFGTGRFRGVIRVTQIDWLNDVPTIVQMVPVVESERDPVSPTEQARTIDTFSAVAAFMRQATYTGRCDGAMRTFDGRLLSEIAAHTVGPEILGPASRSSFQGAALRCDFDWRQTGGFLHDDDQQSVGRPRHGSAWLARMQPGQPMIPVRITFSTGLFGTATLYLNGASQVAGDDEVRAFSRTGQGRPILNE